MLKYLCAIMWKEFRCIKNKFKSLMFSLSVTSLLYFSVFFIKVYTLKDSIYGNVLAAQQSSIYISGLISYLAFIYTLKFWEEKNNRTLDSLFATPLSIRMIILGKVLASVAFSEVVNLTAFTLLNIFFYLYIGSNILSIQTILVSISIPLLFNTPFGIINGYSMWCLSTGFAKIVQLVSMGIIFGTLASIWSGFDKNGLSSSLLYGFMAGAIFLWIVGSYCLIFANKEKALLNMPE